MNWVKGICIVIGALSLLYGLDRMFLYFESRGWIFYRKTKPSSTALGNAFLTLQSMLEPSKKHVIEIRQEVRQEQDGEAGPLVPGERLRDSEEVDSPPPVEYDSRP